MKVQTVHISTRNPRNDADPGECAIEHYVVDNNMVKLTDGGGAMKRYHNGDPCWQALEPGDDPKQIALRLARRYHDQIYGDRRGFWSELPRNGRNTPV